MKVSHISITEVGKGRSLLAVARKASNHIIIKKLAGIDPPVGLLPQILDIALGEEWLREAEELHRSRKNHWRVDVRERTSRHKEYLFRYLKDSESFDLATGGRIRVSMGGRLSEGISIWLGNIPPIMARLMEDYSSPNNCVLTKVNLPEVEDLQLAGTPSGYEGRGDGKNKS